MAGDWIKVRTNLSGDPAVKSMARELRDGVHTVVGRLHALWSWADQHTDDGRLDFTVLADIDDLVDKRGFAAQMVRVGWLHDHGADGVTIPNWDRHNGKSAKKRCLDSEAQRRKREAQSDETRTVSETVSDKKRRLPDQRREEKSNTPIVPASGDEDLGELRDEVGADLAQQDPLLLRAKAIFRMRPGTALDRGQRRAWDKGWPVVASIDESEWQTLEAYYAANIPARDDIRRRDLATLLNNWSGELTRASAWAERVGWHPENSEKKEKGWPDEEIWRAALAALYPDIDPASVPYRTWRDVPDSLKAEVLEAIALAEKEAA